MADFAEAAVAEAASTINDHQSPGQDGDNKFQKAISAWRSRYIGALDYVLLTAV